MAENEEEYALRVYATDAIMNIAENTARPVQGKYLTARWVDILEPAPRDTRTAKEISDDFIERHGLRFAE